MKNLILIILFFTIFNTVAKSETNIRENNNDIEFLNSIKEKVYIKPDSIASVLEKYIMQKEPKGEILIKSNLILALAYKNLSKYDQSLSIYKEILKLVDKQSDYLPVIYNGMGTIYRKKSNNKKALEYYKRAVEISKKLGMEDKLPVRLLNIGLIYYYQSDYDKAYKYYLDALRFAKNYKDSLLIAHSLKEMSSVEKRWGKTNKAKENLFIALKIYQNLKNRKFEAIILNEIGIIYKMEDNLDKAIEFQKKSYEIKKSVNYKYGMATSLNGLGVSYKKLKKYNKAMQYFKRSLVIQNEIKNDIGKAAAISNIGAVFLLQKRYKEALQKFFLSNQIAEKIDYKDVMINNYNLISDTYSKMNKYDKALEYYKKSATLKDSVFNKKKHEQFADMQTKYETEKKEQENELLRTENKLRKIELLKQKSERNFLLAVVLIILAFFVIGLRLYKQKVRANIIIKTQKRELQKLNKTKEILFSVISHDLKNAFTSLILGTEMLNENSDLDRDEISIIAGELERNVKNNFNMMQNLLEWARIQMGRINFKPQKFNLSQSIKEILKILDFNIRKKKLSFVTQIDKELNVYADKRMIFSVIQNLVGNAIKFSKIGGEISIAALQEKDRIKLIISDNGVGISKENLKDLFKIDKIKSTKGTEGEKGTGFGLILCREFILKNKGTIFVDSILGYGTKVTVYLPV